MQKASPFDWLERILMCHTGKEQLDRLLVGLSPPPSAAVAALHGATDECPATHNTSKPKCDFKVLC